MNKRITAGRIIYATGIFGLAIVCIISKDFIVGRPPAWPAGFHINPAFAWITAIALMIFALAIFLNRKARPAAFGIAALIFFFSVLRHLPVFMNDWANAWKTLALFGGSLIIGCSFSKTDTGAGNRYDPILITIGAIFLAGFFIVAGYAHFKFAEFVDTLIPAYIPFHRFWTYFCGICLLAGGIGLLIPKTRKTAALLSAIMVLGWFLLLHIPRFLSNVNDASDRMGLFESFTFVGIFFVLAGISSGSAKQSRPI
jgi:uncharacterized membrane protein YphA (DoxX/SURF4 family)